MKTLKNFALLLALALAIVVTCSAWQRTEALAALLTGYFILFVASHGLTRWKLYRPGIFSAELTFPFDRDGTPVGARIDLGCLSCPTGYAYGADVAINTLERVTNNVLTKGYKDYDMPRFPLAGRAVSKARVQQMTGIRRTRHHVFFENVHRAKWYDPTPAATTFDTMKRLIKQCGGDIATARLIANSNSIGCAPPRGPRGVSGKDAMFQDSATTVFEMGPFCVTDFLELEDFQSHLNAYKTAAIRATGMALEYEKMRRFVAMSRANGVAIAGTQSPRFSAATFDAIPDSPGSLEWLAEAIDMGIGGEIRHGVEINVNVSRQLFQYWLTKFQKDNDITMNLDISNFTAQLKGFAASFNGSDTFNLQSKRTNRRIKITTTMDPVYVEMYRTADGNAEWDFQPYYVTAAGDDSDTNQANGFRQSMNTEYGKACIVCDGEQKRLAEMIFIDVPGEAFHYEAFPTNPLGSLIPGDVETNLQNLWGATEMKWFFGPDVDLYYLKDINAMLEGTGAPCFSNIDRTWFAGRVKTGLMFVEDDPRQMMTLLVAVPGETAVIEKSTCCLPCEPPEAITVTPRPADDPKLCDLLPAGVTEDDAPEGCMRAPGTLRFYLPTAENQTVKAWFERRGGSNGTLTVPFTIVEGTATEGAAGTDHFVRAAGNIVFADGETEKSLDIVLHPFLREEGGAKTVQAIMRFDNAPVVICDEEGATVDTILCFIVPDQLVGEADGCPTAYTLCCEGAELVPAEALALAQAAAKKSARKRGRPSNASKAAAKKAAKKAKATDDTNAYAETE